MNPRERNKVIAMMETWFQKEDKEIDNEFNDIVNNKILHYTSDISTLPCKDIFFSEESIST